MDLPALPNVVVSVLEATEREGVTTTELENTLASDQAILTKLLKVVNSAYFGLPRRISSVSQAITILGLHQVRNLVLSIGVVSALSSNSPRVIESQKRFWVHSLATATLAQSIARRKKMSMVEQELCFVGGMLHGVGRLFLFTLFSLPYQEVVKESKRTETLLSQCEQKSLGTTSSELGAELAERWNFPEELVELIRAHDQVDEESKATAYSVHIASRLATKIVGADGASVEEEVDPVANEWWDVSQEEYVQMEAEVNQRLETANEIFNMAA